MPAAFSQTLFTYGTKSVSTGEFLKAFNKNKTAIPDRQNAIKDYLDLYINFKLKVQAAQQLRMDTLPALINDIENFQGQIASSYLSDDAAIQALVKEAFVRSNKDVRFAYLFIPANNSDTSAAFTAINAAYRGLQSRRPAKAIAEAYIGLKAAYMDAGYVSAFTIPYQFETIIYNLTNGESSKPVKTGKGYYIFIREAERRSAGKIKAAQILIGLPPGATDQQKATAKKIADSVYNKLIAGADFATMAEAVSNDRLTAAAGGMMQEFTAGTFDPEFENAFVDLHVNNISKPVETAFGFHIIKLLKRSNEATDSTNAEQKEIMRQKVINDARMQIAQDKFLKSVFKTLGYRSNNIKETSLAQIADSFFISNKNISIGNVNNKTALFMLLNKSYTVIQFLNFAKNYRASDASKGESVSELLKLYINTSALDFYKANLNKYNPEYRYQIQEFKDGNLLFEIMDKYIWTKAAVDTTGLKRFYEKNKAKYVWQKSADAIVISVSDTLMPRVSAALISKNTEQIKATFPEAQIDSSRYEFAQLTLADSTNIIPGRISSTTGQDGISIVTKIIKVYPAGGVRNLEQARGSVLNDYQNWLEEQWIQQLKKKYSVKINQSVLQSLYR
ncbi:hypothetical protein BH09BAC2_BH09BAC2_06170 [soil metagenome]